jgi:hypothetical protein
LWKTNKVRFPIAIRRSIVEPRCFSQGGGATHDLIEALYANRELITRMATYLDAVDHHGIGAENDWPDVAFHLLSFYETIEELPLPLGGGDINDDEKYAGTTLEEYFYNNLDHYQIDDEPLIQNLIRTRLQQLLIFR